MPILLALNGYLTIGGLILSGIGSLVQLFEPEVGTSVQQTGLALSGVGATRKGVKKYKGMPVF